jgi:HSP20 family protein
MKLGSYSEVWERFDSISGHFDCSFVGFTPDLSKAWRGSCFIPQVDIKETADLYILTMNIPGIRIEDLEITVTDHDLVLKGSRMDRIRELVSYHHKERHTGSIKTRIHLPTAVRPQEMTKSYRNGILSILLKKKA